MRDLLVPALSVIWMAMILYLAWYAWTRSDPDEVDLDQVSEEFGTVPVPADMK